MKPILIAQKMTEIDERFILGSMPPAPGTVLPKPRRESAFARFASSGWGVAIISGVVALGVLTAIVLAGRNPPALPPVTTDNPPPVTESTAEDTEVDTDVSYTEGLEYTPVQGKEGYCYVSGSKKMSSRTKIVRIPETSPDGLIVRYIGPEAFRGNTNVTEVILPDSVEVIFEYAFLGCFSLEKVTVGENFGCVKSYAFYHCSSLKDINLSPEHIIQTSAMYGTPWLNAHTEEFVIYGDNLIDYNGDGRDVVVPNGVKQIYGGTFEGNTTITSVIIPDSCSVITGSVFYGCSALESITVPSSVVAIGGDRTFGGCTSLQSIDLPGVLEIAHYGFKDATALTYVNMPNVQSIGMEAFANCTSLTQVETSAMVILDYCFSRCYNLQEIILLDGVQTLGVEIFQYCTALERIVIPSTVTQIGNISAISSENLVIEYAGTAEDWAKIQMNEKTAEILRPYVQFSSAN